MKRLRPRDCPATIVRQLDASGGALIWGALWRCGCFLGVLALLGVVG